MFMTWVFSFSYLGHGSTEHMHACMVYIFFCYTGHG